MEKENYAIKVLKEAYMDIELTLKSVELTASEEDLVSIHKSRVQVLDALGQLENPVVQPSNPSLIQKIRNMHKLERRSATEIANHFEIPPKLAFDIIKSEINQKR